MTIPYLYFAPGIQTRTPRTPAMDSWDPGTLLESLSPDGDFLLPDNDEIMAMCLSWWVENLPVVRPVLHDDVE